MPAQALSRRAFPHTTLEPGMRTSIVTLLGYADAVVVVAWRWQAWGSAWSASPG